MTERSCRTCKYDTEMYEQNFCTLRKDIVMEFAKEHLGFPDDFKILDNWFMGLEPCKFYEVKGSKAYGVVEKEALEKLGEVCVDMWERSPAYNQFVHILQEFVAYSKITPWDIMDSPFATNTSSIWCLPFDQYKRLRKLQIDLKNFLDSAKQGFDEKIYRLDGEEPRRGGLGLDGDDLRSP